MPTSYCIIKINATNNVNGETYSFQRQRIESGPSSTLLFNISERELPFDARYTSTLSLKNSYSEKTVQAPVNLSM